MLIKSPALLKRNLWREFSLFIKVRDNYTCITCGRQGTGNGMHAGHFVPSAVGGLALRYNEANVHAQCYHCNINLGGWGERYTEVLEKRHGKKYVNDLRKLKYKLLNENQNQKGNSPRPQGGENVRVCEDAGLAQPAGI